MHRFTLLSKATGCTANMVQTADKNSFVKYVTGRDLYILHY